MPKKKKTKIPPSYIKLGVTIVLVLIVGLGIVFTTNQFLQQSKYFDIKIIIIDPSLAFIEKGELERLIGLNIFQVDIKKIQDRLRRRYPQVSDLKLIKQFPNQILLTATKRIPIAQLFVGKQLLTLDKRGIVLSTQGPKDDKITFVTGVGAVAHDIVLGLPVNNRHVEKALEIMNVFAEQEGLARFEIQEMDVENLSRIEFLLSNKLSVILDWDSVSEKLNVLSLILAQGQLDLKDVKYIDLRFKEPVIGKK